MAHSTSLVAFIRNQSVREWLTGRDLIEMQMVKIKPLPKQQVTRPLKEALAESTRSRMSRNQFPKTQFFMPSKVMRLPLAASPPLWISDTNQNLRLQWSPELHQRFVVAVEQLGGAIDAKPTAILQAMERMGVRGLTLRKVKSHLQTYRNKGRDEVEEQLQYADDDIEESHNADALSIAVVPTSGIGVQKAHAVENSQMEVCKRILEEMEAVDYMQLLGGAQDKSVESFDEDPYDAAIREFFNS